MRNASVHLSIVGTLSLVILGLDSSWPLSVICRIPPEHKSWSSTFPFNRRSIFIYWWAQIFWHSCRGTCADMSSPPKRRVSSPPGQVERLLGVARNSEDIWVNFGCLGSARCLQRNVRIPNLFEVHEICTGMIASVGVCRTCWLLCITFLMWIWGMRILVAIAELQNLNRFVRPFWRPQPLSSAFYSASASSTTLPSISSARHNQDKSPMSSKNLKLCGLFFDNFVGLSRILFETEKVIAHISCADGYCAAA